MFKSVLTMDGSLILPTHIKDPLLYCLKNPLKDKLKINHSLFIVFFV